MTTVDWTPTITKSLGSALVAAVSSSLDGAGVDTYFRNSGVVISGDHYWGVNGVHPVIDKDYTSYYPKSIVKASISTDTQVARYPFSAAFGHDVDMEALTWGPDEGATYLYVGDEYNYIYQMQLSDGTLTREWDLNSIVGAVSVDKGIESLTYAPSTGYFYAGIQDTGMVHVLNIDVSGTSVTEVNSFSVAKAPSGLFYYAAQDMLYAFAGTSTNGDQYLYAYTPAGALQCSITIPSSVGISRGDGFYIDGDHAYIVDSQGPMHTNVGSMGYNLYQVEWSNPCGLTTSAVPPLPPGTAQSPSPSPPPPADEDSASAATGFCLWKLACVCTVSALLLRTGGY